MRLKLLWPCMMLCLGSCGAEPEIAKEQVSYANAADAYQAPLERWSVNDDASLFKTPLEYNLARLPVQGSVAQNPWVGSYWPTFLDSINHRWAGPNQESPAHKYGRAFGVSNVESNVSRFHGLDSVRGSSCSNYGSCGQGMMCGHKAGYAQGSCVPLWWGICHAWAAASILHEEPQHAVVHNGVTFNVTDLKALLTLVYNTAETKQISLRCERSKSEISYDAAHRPVESACRDSNAGTFHLVLTNFIGLQRRAFIEDRSMDSDVWNQPVRQYRVLQMKEISQHKANRVLGIGGSDYPYNHAAQRFVYVSMDVGYLREAAPDVDGFLGNRVNEFTFHDIYNYVLELDRHGNIIGGEWANISKRPDGAKDGHPDFLWVPLGPNSSAVAGGAIRFDNVMELVRKSY